MENNNPLLLKNQLCFPTYAVSNLILRKYQPILEKLDLTYTQYIVMLVMWEKNEVNETELSKALHLKSNTLGPLLKKLKYKEYIKISKNKNDKRNLVISITEKGLKLKENAAEVPYLIAKEFNLSKEEAETLYKILYKILDSEKEEN